MELIPFPINSPGKILEITNSAPPTVGRMSHLPSTWFFRQDTTQSPRTREDEPDMTLLNSLEIGLNRDNLFLVALGHQVR